MLPETEEAKACWEWEEGGGRIKCKAIETQAEKVMQQEARGNGVWKKRETYTTPTGK